MKKLMTVLMAAALILSAAGCSSVSEEDYQSALDAKASLESRLDENKKDLDSEKSAKDELVSQNDALTSEMAALESKVTELEAELSAIEAEETAGDVEVATDQPETPAELAEMFREIYAASPDGANITVDYDEATDTMSFSVAEEGGAGVVAAAKEGDANNKSAWETVKLMYMSEVYGSLATANEAAGFADTNIVVNIISDENPDEILLTIENGKVVHDAVEAAA